MMPQQRHCDALNSSWSLSCLRCLESTCFGLHVTILPTKLPAETFTHRTLVLQLQHIHRQVTSSSTTTGCRKGLTSLRLGNWKLRPITHLVAKRYALRREPIQVNASESCQLCKQPRVINCKAIIRRCSILPWGHKVQLYQMSAGSDGMYCFHCRPDAVKRQLGQSREAAERRQALQTQVRAAIVIIQAGD